MFNNCKISTAPDLFNSDEEHEEQPRAVHKSRKRSRRSSSECSEPSPSTSRRKTDEGDQSTSERSKPSTSASRKKPDEASSSNRSEPLPSSKKTYNSRPTIPIKNKKIRFNPISQPIKPSMKDLFGSDSEEDGNGIPAPEDRRKAPLPSTESRKVICEKCNVEMSKTKYRYHIRTNIHKKNCLLKSEFENIDIIATAFKNRIMTYRLNPAEEDEYLTPEAFLRGRSRDVLKLITISLLKNTCIKLNFELFANFVLPHSGKQELKSFNTKYDYIFNNTDINETFANAIEIFIKKLSEFEHHESGWSFVSVSHLEININKYNPMRGGTYLDLPPVIKNKKCCLNIQNKDEQCFLWSIVAALFPAKSNACRTSSYPHPTAVFNTEGMHFPPSCKDIKWFESNNDISINIYGLSNKGLITGPLYLTKERNNNHVNLLYFENNCTGHYCLIKDFIRLVRGQLTKFKGKLQICEACLSFFTSENKFKTHNCSQVLTVVPNKNSRLRFKHFERKQKINFVVYADFESLLVDSTESSSGNTQNLKIHIPACFAYYICCSHDPSLNKYVSYRGSDCAEVFIQKLINDIKRLHRILIINNPMKPLSKLQQKIYDEATSCHICGELLFGDKVQDHDHITSEFRGASHSYCNLMFRVCPFIPVIFHNLTNYDSHLFIKELVKYSGSITVIPKTKEKYMSITKYIKTKDSTRPIQIKFIDSFQFLSSSLDVLSKSLADEDYANLSRQFNGKNVSLLKTKGIYPYDYMDSWHKYDEEVLPSKEYFYNTLKMEHISDHDYNHAQTVWKEFNTKNLGDYTDLYLKCDVLLLCDIFEKFRNISLHHYKLDPCYYISSPSLSWDAMLYLTGVELDLIDDLEMYQMLEKGIRGGLVQCSLRHAEANNKYLSNYDDSVQSSYLLYLDCNNLYGYAMMKSLPVSEFKFLNEDEIQTFNIYTIPENGEKGFILDVDLEYPENMHDFHSELPFAPEKFIPPGGKTSKLIANLYDKYNYVIHFVHLKECLKNGLILKKINRIVCFRQSKFLKKYIELNTSLRQASSTTFEKDFFKLMNNAIFGKTIENRRKQVNVKLITKWTDKDNVTNKEIGAEKLICKPNLKNITVFSENFIAVQLSPEKILLDRPIYIGFSVLEYAKQHLYKFHYNFIKNKYSNNKAKLCYTDTDSLLYFIYTDDIYQDIKNHQSEFDTSNFDPNNPYHIQRKNSKVPGLFKDELGGEVVSEYVGLRAKLYCLNSLKSRINKAKGVSKCVTEKLKLSQYKNILLDGGTLKRDMNLIKSSKHTLFSQKLNKVVLNSNDDKRQILSNKIETLPWGHYRTVF